MLEAICILRIRLNYVLGSKNAFPEAKNTRLKPPNAVLQIKRKVKSVTWVLPGAHAQLPSLSVTTSNNLTKGINN